MDCSILSSFFSSDIEMITLCCSPFYLFISLVLVSVYITSQAHAMTAIDTLSKTVCDIEIQFPDWHIMYTVM